MPTPQSRSHFRRALRASWRVLKLTLAPSRPALDALDDPESPPPPPLDLAQPKPETEQVAWEEAEPASKVEPAPSAVKPTPDGVQPSPPGDAAASTVGDPAPSAAASSVQSPTAPAAPELLSLIQARLDLCSERLDLLRDQVATALAIANSTRREPARPTRVARPGSLRRELGRLSERLNRLERLERKGPPADELPSRAALRPPRVPTGLDLFETVTNTGTSNTEWDFLEGAVMGPRLSGTFQELRLATLLEVLQLERRVGVLLLRTPEHTLELDLRRGTVTGVRLDGAETDVVAAVREAFRWPNAEFGFRRSDVVRESGAPRSIHGVLLEVLRQNDEATRAG